MKERESEAEKNRGWKKGQKGQEKKRQKNIQIKKGRYEKGEGNINS